MIKRTILLIIEIAIYAFIMNKLGYLNEKTMIVGTLVSLGITALCILDDINKSIDKVHTDLIGIIVGLDLKDKIVNKRDEFRDL